MGASDFDLTSFWGHGEPRSADYESGLRIVLPGYNTSSEGFLTYRPDYVVHPFRPCSVSNAVNDTNEAIRSAIKRQGHVFEFTAIARPSVAGIQTYLRKKLPNYVQITQEH